MLDKPVTVTTKSSGSLTSFWLTGLFITLSLLSGFCGIAYEVLYGRILSDLVGNQFAVNASILLTFLAGIGIGALMANRFKLYLWLIELGIGLYAGLFILSIPVIDHLLYLRLPAFSLSIYASLGICFLLLVLPAFLIGVSLPLFAEYARGFIREKAFATTYACYNFGAAITVILIEFLLIRKLGIQTSMTVIAVINAAIALALWLIINRYGNCFKPINHRPKSTAQFTTRWLLALAFASIGSAIFQLTMVRIGECILGPFRETFALVLCLVLLGIAVGAVVQRAFQLRFSFLMLVSMVGLLWLVGGFATCVGWYAYNYDAASQYYASSVILKFAFIFVLMILPASAFGATVPALLKQEDAIARDSGHLLFVASMANVFGFLLMVFVLHPYVSYHTLFIAVLACALLAFWCYEQRWLICVAVTGVAVLFTVLIGHLKLWDEHLLYLGHRSFFAKNEMEKNRSKFAHYGILKGPQDVFSIVSLQNNPLFFINGYISIPLKSPNEKVVGAISSIFAPRNDRALVLGLGSGSTAATVGLLFDQTETVEINKVVVDNIARLKEYNFDIEQNERVTIIHDDGIHYLKKRNSPQYSLILNTVTTPHYFSSSKLYTADFFKHVKHNLTHDGIYITWMDSSIGARGTDIILRTITDSFEHVGIAYITNAYFLLIASEQPIFAHQPEIVTRHKVLNRYFKDEGINPNWLQLQLLDNDIRPLANTDADLINTIDHPILEFAMAQSGRSGFGSFLEALGNGLSLERLQRSIKVDKDWNPIELLLHTQVQLGNHPLAMQWRTILMEQVADFDDQYVKTLWTLEKQQYEDAPQSTQDFKYANLLVRQGQYEAAIPLYQNVLEEDPYRNNAWLYLGTCYEALEQYESAIEHYQKELDVDFDDFEVRYRVGRCLLKKGDFQEAVEVLNRATVNRRNADTYFYLGEAYLGLRDKAAARAQYELALEYNPGHQPSLQRLLQL